MGVTQRFFQTNFTLLSIHDIHITLIHSLREVAFNYSRRITSEKNVRVYKFWAYRFTLYITISVLKQSTHHPVLCHVCFSRPHNFLCFQVNTRSSVLSMCLVYLAWHDDIFSIFYALFACMFSSKFGHAYSILNLAGIKLPYFTSIYKCLILFFLTFNWISKKLLLGKLFN